jgi:hypothetical protein
MPHKIKALPFKENKQTESEGGDDKTEHMFVEMQCHLSFLAPSQANNEQSTAVQRARLGALHNAFSHNEFRPIKLS